MLLVQGTAASATVANCGDSTELPVIEARDFLKSAAPTIVAFAAFSFKSEFGHCTKVEPESSIGFGRRTAFKIRFQGEGTDLFLEFDSTGALLGLEASGEKHNNQFVLMDALFSGIKEQTKDHLDSLKTRFDDQGRQWSSLLVGITETALDALDEKHILDARHVLLTILKARQRSWIHPPTSTFAVLNRYVSNVPVQVVFLEPSDAARVQAGLSKLDYSAAFLAMDLNNPGVGGPIPPLRDRDTSKSQNTKLVLAGVKFTPILDAAVSELHRTDVDKPLDDTILRQHCVRGLLSRPVPLFWSNTPSGNSTILVELEDGNFGMIVEGVTLDAHFLEFYHPPAPNPLDELNRRFSGSIEDFNSALPAFVERAARALKLDPATYRPEVDYILARSSTSNRRAKGFGIA